MTRYVDVSVRRIQRWLVRSPNLRGRRGASGLLRDATAPSAAARVLEGFPAEVNPEVGAVDGVISVRLHPDATDDVAVEVQHRLLQALRADLPAADLSAQLREGPDYATAVAAGATASSDWLAALPEWPAARRCEWCQNWPASASIHAPGPGGHGGPSRSGGPGGRARLGGRGAQVEVLVCADCARRDRRAGRNRDAGDPSAAEADLLAHLLSTPAVPSAVLPNDFTELAETGPRPGETTHLATVYVDGNAVGAYIDALRRWAKPRPRNPRPERAAELRGAADAIHSATWTALITATERRHRDAPSEHGALLPILPHYVGGDDVLVSVPAHHGWEFTITLLRTFTEALTPAARRSDDSHPPPPTASAGLVFHHRSEPFSTVVDLAAQWLGHAKQEHRGEAAAIGWQSVTHDGVAPAARPTVDLAVLEKARPALAALAALPASTRQTLARIGRELDDEALYDQLDRIPFPGGTLTDVAAPFRPGPPTLDDALDMVRWWWT